MCYDHIHTMTAIFLTILPKIKGLTQVKGTTTGLNSPLLRRVPQKTYFSEVEERK